MADRTVTYTFRGDVSGLVSSMAAAGTSVKSLGTQMTALDAKGARMRAGLTTVGSAAGKLGLVAAGGLAASAKAAIDWESDWAGVMKTVDGSSSQLQALEGDLREMARSMPATHTEIAQVAEAAGQLGVATGDVASFTKTMIMLGETTNLSADEAATSIAQMANVMGTAPGDIDNVGAALVALGNDGASTESQILGMAQRISAAGAQIGLTESDILAIANASASMGVEVEAGGTAISTVFTEMAKATKSGGSELEDFARTAGMSGEQFIKAFQDDPAQAFASFVSGLDQVNQSGGNVFGLLEDLGLNGVRVSQSLLGLSSSGDLLTDSLELGASAFEQNSALMAEYGKRAGTTASEMQVAWNNVKDAGIEVGAAALPAIGDMAEKVGTAAGAFQKLPESVKGATTSLLGITAVTGGSLWFGSKIINGVADAREALTNLGVSANTTKGALRGIGAGLSFLAIVEGLNLVDTALDSVFDRKLDESNLNRELQALGSGQNIDNLGEIGEHLRNINNGFLTNVDKVFSWFPGKGETERNREEIEKVDQALASMVESGNAEQAASAFQAIQKQATDLGVSSGDVVNSFEQYGLALDNLNGRDAGGFMGIVGDAMDRMRDAAGGATGPTDQYGNAVGGAGDQAADAAVDVNALTQAMRDQANAAVSNFGAQTQWGQAVADARQQAESGARGIDAYTEAGRANRSALENLASSWNGQGAAIKNNTKEYGKARRTFLDVADAMDIPARRARQLADRLLEMPKSTIAKLALQGAGNAVSEADRVKLALQAIDQTQPKPVVGMQIGLAMAGLSTVDQGMNRTDRTTATPAVGVAIGAAMAGIGTVRGNLNAVDRQNANPNINAVDNASGVIAGIRAGIAGIQSKTVHITTVEHRRITRSSAPDHLASGGHVTGPGSETSDSIPAMLSHNEFVMRGAAVRKYGLARMNAMNDLRFADGGHVGTRAGYYSLPHFAEGGSTTKKKAAQKAKERRQAVRTAVREFDIDPTGGRAEARREVNELMRSLKKAGVTWTTQMRLQGNQLVKTTGNYARLTRALDNHKEQLDDIKRDRAEYRKTVAGSFDNDPFGNGIAGLQLQLAADRNDSTSMLAAIKQANRRGLDRDSGLAKAVMASGDLTTDQQLAKLSSAEIDKLERQYALRTQAQNSLGSYASTQVYAVQQRAAERIVQRHEQALDRMGKKIDRLEKNIGPNVQRGAHIGTANGTRASYRARNRTVSLTIKAGRR